MSETAILVGASSSWARALVKISPYTFSAIGIAISIGVSVLGAAWLDFFVPFLIFLGFRCSIYDFGSYLL